MDDRCGTPRHFADREIADPKTCVVGLEHLDHGVARGSVADSDSWPVGCALATEAMSQTSVQAQTPQADHHLSLTPMRRLSLDDAKVSRCYYAIWDCCQPNFKALHTPKIRRPRRRVG